MLQRVLQCVLQCMLQIEFGAACVLQCDQDYKKQFVLDPHGFLLSPTHPPIVS